MRRFKDDPEWGRVLNRFRNGSPSPGDFALIDRHVVVNGTTRDGDMIPPNIQRAAHANRDRSLSTLHRLVSLSHGSQRRPCLLSVWEEVR
jgi:hypothetical protein